MASNYQQLDKLNRMLECPICLERIVEPRTLQCLHSFCQKCLAHHMKEKQLNGSFPCPICKAEFAIPKDGVVGFKQNFFLREITNLLVTDPDLKCDKCKVEGKDSDATSVCLQCKIHLCRRCSMFHCRIRVYTNHSVVSLDVFRGGQHSDASKSPKEAYCSLHHKVLDICCKECMKPVCSQCTITEHKQHEMQTINEAANFADKDLRNLLEIWTAAAEHCEQLCEQRKNIIEGIEQQGNEKATQVKSVYKSLNDDLQQKILKINEEKTTALDMLEIEVKRAKKQAEVACNQAELSKATVTSAVEYTQQILLESTEDIDKLQHFHDVKMRLDPQHLKNIEFLTSTPHFYLKPNDIKLPDVQVPMAVFAFQEKNLVKSNFIQQKCKLLEQPVQVKCFRTRLPSERECKSCGIFINNDVLITTDWKNTSVKMFHWESGTSLLVMNGQQHKFNNPIDVACNQQGEIFVTDQDLRGVLKYDNMGKFMLCKSKLFAVAGYIACVRDKLALSDPKGARMIIADFDCNIEQVLDKVSLGLPVFNPYYVCEDNNGHLVVADEYSKCVYVIDQTGPTVLQKYTNQLIQRPSGICVDLFGNILVAEFQKSQVLMIDPQGNVSVCIEDKMISYCVALSVKGLGEVAVLEFKSGKVKVFKYCEGV